MILSVAEAMKDFSFRLLLSLKNATDQTVLGSTEKTISVFFFCSPSNAQKLSNTTQLLILRSKQNCTQRMSKDLSTTGYTVLVYRFYQVFGNIGGDHEQCSRSKNNVILDQIDFWTLFLF